MRNRRAGVEDRWTKTIRADGNTQTVPSANHGKGKRWRARYVDEQGREHAQSFGRKVDAQQWLDEVTAAVVTGQYVDPKAGQVTFRDYAEQWRKMQVQRPGSRAHVETMLRRHAYPTLGDRCLSSIMPSDIQAWVKGLELAPATVGVIHGIVSTVMKVGDPGSADRVEPVRRNEIAEGAAQADCAADDQAGGGGPRCLAATTTGTRHAGGGYRNATGRMLRVDGGPCAVP